MQLARLARYSPEDTLNKKDMCTSLCLYMLHPAGQNSEWNLKGTSLTTFCGSLHQCACSNAELAEAKGVHHPRPHLPAEPSRQYKITCIHTIWHFSSLPLVCKLERLLTDIQYISTEGLHSQAWEHWWTHLPTGQVSIRQQLHALHAKT